MNINKIQNLCLKKLSSDNWTSYDPYDALTNPFLEKISSKSDLLRRVLIQINAKSPFNLRWLGMKKMIHTKTISDMLWFYSISNQENKVANVDFFFNLLIKQKNNKGYGWGLNFPYTSRFINADSDMPNLYNTVNSGLAICHAFKFLDTVNQLEAVKALKGILVFLDEQFGFVDEGDRGWYLYYPGQKHPTYNVNALTLYFFSHLKVLNHHEIEINHDKYMKILNLLIKEQNQDGSWFYARSEKGKWIDGFHSAFIIESLAFNYVSNVSADGLEEAIESAWKFYKKEMFTEEGYPRYFVESRKYPIESQNCAQSIQTIACICNWLKKSETQLLKKVINNTIVNLYNDEGYFYFKKTKYWTHKTSFSRWSNTPMILALEYAEITLRDCK
jgi:hypothetical protein